MWARIEDNKVVELTDINPKGQFHTSLVWVKCPATVTAGMLYVDGKFRVSLEVDAMYPWSEVKQ